MATVTAYTAARMASIEGNCIVSGAVVGNDLILTKFNTATVNAGVVKGPQGNIGPSGPNTQVIPMTFVGTLSVVVGSVRWYAPGTFTISNVIVSVGTAPTGAAIIVDINKNGTTIFTTQGNRPTIAISGFADTSSAPAVTGMVAGDYLTVDIDQIGSTVPGANLTVQIVGTLT